ncbi:MAG TPA: DEAD/DEAH box helicase [Gaiellaceae bacterium]|jgi:ATP-dependent RNA helicase RhlE|nr:DEAD/DEAH box helicase [Gaiellaceae bacterium]
MQHSFRALGVSDAVERALADLDIVEPFRIQSLVLPDAIAGRDVLAKAPTGSGKTLAFGLPIVERITGFTRAPEALVLVPTRELAIQVAASIEAFAIAKGVHVGVAYGGAPVGAQAKRLKGAQLVVATPGRLQDLVDRKMVSLDGIRILVLDEADRMLDMGFLPQVERILRRLPRDRQTMLFSATLDGEVGELARAYTSDPSRFETQREVANDDGVIEHEFVPVTPEGKVDTLVELLQAEDGLSLVFVRTKRGADRLTQKLSRRGVDVIAMHGDMGQRQRERALERFRSGRSTTLVATDVAARGLDLEDIAHVINFDPPEDDKGYVHRVGRTGRAGRSGRGSTLVLPEQQGDVSRVAARLGHTEEFESTGMRTARPKLVYTSRRGRRSRW